MRIIGCDLHSRQQTLAMLDIATGEVERTTLRHEGNNVRESETDAIRAPPKTCARFQQEA
jgi:hypothetical protein